MPAGRCAPLRGVLCAVALTRSAWVVPKGPCKKRWVPSQVVHEASWLCRSVMGFSAAKNRRPKT